VIKVEPPGGDLVRQRQPLRDAAHGKTAGRHSAYYGNLNAGKESLCVDLRKDAGRALVRELTDKADVVLENFRPGVMQRLGFDYATLKPGNPRLVYCSISGFGQSGAEAGRASYAMVVHAMSGFDLANLGYQPDLERPLNTGIFVADILSGTFAFGAINAALVRRERSGEGEHIDLAMMDAMFGLMPYETAEAQFPATKKRFLYRPIQARDGFVVLAPISQANFEAMARGAGREDWIGDARFKDNLSRESNWDALMRALDEWAADKSALDCEQAMAAAGVPCSRYLSVREAMALPYCEERGSFSVVRDGAGEFRTPNAPFRMAQAGIRRPDRVAALGEDNRAIAGRLGYAEERIRALEGEGVLVSR
jgi:crotonobetainyl-CoA:carnitine CoA-transferase CaiB-like acyl-CoA transferase